MQKTLTGRWVCHDPGELDRISETLLKEAGDARVMAFSGDLGAGKTTLIQALCRRLGIAGPVASPTFSLLHEYQTPQGNPVYHFDFYRIKDIAEVYDLGYEDYFYSGFFCFIEWPEKIETLLPENCIRVAIEQSGASRIITLNP